MRNFTLRTLAMLMVFLSVKVYAEDAVTFSEGALNFQATSDKSCKLVSVTTACPIDLTIPATVSNNGTDYSVTVIGENAFNNCASMNSVVIPATVEYIANGAFFKTTKLKTITCLGTTPPDCSASPFATSTYMNCTVTIPEGTWTAYTMAMPRMYNIMEVGYKTVSITVDGATVTYGTISEKDKLAIFESITPKPVGEYTMPDEVELEGVKYKVSAIKTGAFVSDANLTSINLSKNLLSIGPSAFNKCNGLKTVELPEGLFHMNTSAFAYCDSLEYCKLPSTLKRMESSIFIYCKSLKSADIPKGVEYMGQSVYGYCSSLESCNGFETVDSIAGSMFAYCSTLKEIKFPTSPKIQSVPTGTFQACTSLRNVELGNNITVLENSSFTMCDSLRTLKIPETVTTISSSAFAKDSLLSEIIIPERVTSIGSTCFGGCVSLKSIEFPAGVTVIPTNIFSGCTALTTVTVKGKITEIGQTAFTGCTNLKFDIPESVTKLGISAFQNCTSLTSVKIPETIKVLPNTLFAGCKKLKEVKMADDVTAIGTGTFKLTGLETFSLPESIAAIGNQAFLGDSLLTSIKLPAELTTLGTSVFSNCAKLSEITLPSKVTNIGATCFKGCAALLTVTSLNPVPPGMTASTAFDEYTYTNAKLVVPAGAEQAYMDNVNWKRFIKLTSGVEEIQTSSWITTGHGYIESTIPVTVYSISGQTIGSFCGYKAVSPGLYIVKGDNKVLKLLVK